MHIITRALYVAAMALSALGCTVETGESETVTCDEGLEPHWTWTGAGGGYQRVCAPADDNEDLD